MVVMHKCDNRQCINIEHLQLGTQQQNVVDMFNKGRGVRRKGEEHPVSKLTEEQVLHIYKTRESAKDLALKYGVHISTIHYIRNGKNWSWLTKGVI